MDFLPKACVEMSVFRRSGAYYHFNFSGKFPLLSHPLLGSHFFPKKLRHDFFSICGDCLRVKPVVIYDKPILVLVSTISCFYCILVFYIVGVLFCNIAARIFYRTLLIVKSFRFSYKNEKIEWIVVP